MINNINIIPVQNLSLSLLPVINARWYNDTLKITNRWSYSDLSLSKLSFYLLENTQEGGREKIRNTKSELFELIN